MTARYLKLLSAVAIAFMIPQMSLSQSVVQYIYDSAGNRISQVVPSNRHGDSFGNRQDSGQGRTTSGQLAGHSVSITVLESRGLVTVEILGPPGKTISLCMNTATICKASC